MVTLMLSVGLNFHFICLQDKCELILEGQQLQQQNPILKCPKCGFRIQVSSQAAAQPGPQPLPGSRFQRPQPKA